MTPAAPWMTSEKLSRKRVYPLVVLFALEAVDMAIWVLRRVRLENCSDFQTDIRSQSSRGNR